MCVIREARGECDNLFGSRLLDPKPKSSHPGVDNLSDCRIGKSLDLDFDNAALGRFVGNEQLVDVVRYPDQHQGRWTLVVGQFLDQIRKGSSIARIRKSLEFINDDQASTFWEATGNSLCCEPTFLQLCIPLPARLCR